MSMRNQVRKITLRNGFRLLLIPEEGSTTTTVLLLVEAGSEYETKNMNGISHFLEHMVFKGTTRRPRSSMVAAELDSLGARYNAFTGEENTGYWAKVEGAKAEKALDIVSDLYLNPLFNHEEIDKERGVIIEEINMFEDMPMRRVHDFFKMLLYGNQPAGWDIAGRKEVIRRLTRTDFLQYRAAHYVAPKTVMVVAGNFNETKMVRLVTRLFGNLVRSPRVPKSKTKESQKRPKVVIRRKESDQTHLVLGVRGFTVFDRRRFILQVAADVLGGGMSSRLFRRIREDLGAAYYVHADAEFSLDHGFLAASAGVDHRRIEKVIEIILEEFTRLTRELVPKDELKRVKDHFTGNLLLGLETSDEIAGYYGGQEILTKTLLSPRTLIARIQKVRAEEIRRVARAVFTPANLNLAVIGPYAKTFPFQKILKL